MCAVPKVDPKATVSDIREAFKCVCVYAFRELYLCVGIWMIMTRVQFSGKSGCTS